MKLDEIIKKSKKAQDILKKAEEKDNRLYNVLLNIKQVDINKAKHLISSDVKQLDIDKAESMVDYYEKIINYLDEILEVLPLEKEENDIKKRKSLKDYPDKNRFKIYQYLLSLYFKDKNAIIETSKIAKKFKISNKVTGAYLQHNKGLVSIKLNKHKFKDDFLDKTLEPMVNMYLAEYEYLEANNINKKHAKNVGVFLGRNYKSYGLERKIASGNIRRYFRK